MAKLSVTDMAVSTPVFKTTARYVIRIIAETDNQDESASATDLLPSLGAVTAAAGSASSVMSQISQQQTLSRGAPAVTGATAFASAPTVRDKPLPEQPASPVPKDPAVGVGDQSGSGLLLIVAVAIAIGCLLCVAMGLVFFDRKCRRRNAAIKQTLEQSSDGRIAGDQTQPEPGESRSEPNPDGEPFVSHTCM
jgi:hypothetical protein